jgi:hypothetical protein
MTDTLLNLGQVYPSAGVLTTAYTVPGAATVVLSEIQAANTGSYRAKIRVSIAVAGAADTSAQYIVYDEIVPANKPYRITGGKTLGATDVIRVYSDTGTVAFNISGVQVT